HYGAPPAQNRTGPIKASGSHLGYLTAKRIRGHGWRTRGEGSQRSMIPRIFAHVVQSLLASALERAPPQVADVMLECAQGRDVGGHGVVTIPAGDPASQPSSLFRDRRLPCRLGADAVRYSFIVVDWRHLLLAGLPAHRHRNTSPIKRSSD